MAEEKEKVEEQPTTVTTETTTVETAPAEGAADAAPAKSARDIFRDSVKEFAPDDNFDEDEDAMFAKANELISSLKEKGAKLDEFNNKLLNRFKEDPDDAEVFLRYADGEPLVSAIVRVKGREGLAEPAEGEEGWEDFMKAREDNRSRRAENEKLAEEMKKNAEDTAARFDKFAKDNNLSDEEKQALWDMMYGQLDNIARGIFTDEFMASSLSAKNRDRDVEAAKKQGEADGRNEKLEVERKRMQGSGLPGGAGGASAGEEIESEEKPNGTADWLSKMSKRR